MDVGCDQGFTFFFFFFFLTEPPDKEQKWTHDAPTWSHELGKSFLVDEFYVLISDT